MLDVGLSLGTAEGCIRGIRAAPPDAFVGAAAGCPRSLLFYLLLRERARIQIGYKLFQASPEVRRSRRTLSEEETEKAVEDKPVRCLSLIAQVGKMLTG